MELNLIFSILDRSKADKMTALCQSRELPLTLTLLGRGTAKKKHLDLYGLEAVEKAVILTIADNEKTQLLMKDARKKLYIDISGNGVMLAVPIKCIGGGRTMAFLSDSQTPGCNQAPGMNFEYELIVAVTNEGFTDSVMDAARAAGASGGTVLHAKGSASKKAERFFNLTLLDEREIILIGAKAEHKAEIMRQIISSAGPESPAGTLVFSLPVTHLAGLNFLEEPAE